MNNNWDEMKIGDLCEVFDGPHATPKKAKEGPIFLGISSLENGRINFSASDHIDENDFKKWTRRVTPKSEDIVFSYETRLGEVGIIPSGIRCCLGRRMGLLRIKDQGKLDPLFLLYYYLGPKYQQIISQRTVYGSTVDRIPLKEVPNFPITIPPLVEQKKIVSILSVIDQKIELNKRNNETLQEISKSIFKSWFIDFDPVREKSEDQVKVLPNEISDLFPDSFEDSELGLIPTGWKVVQLEDLVKNINRGISPKYTDQEEYPVINQKCIRNSQINFSLCKFTEYKKNIESKFLKKYDVLVNSMGVGTLGRVSLFISHDKNILVDGCVTFIRGKTEVYSLFIFQNLLLREKEIINLSTGSTGQTSLSKESLLNMYFIKPGEKILERFSYMVRDLYIQRNNNIIQNNYLMSLRDTLLPKLISGELRIPDAEKIIEKVGI